MIKNSGFMGEQIKCPPTDNKQRDSESISASGDTSPQNADFIPHSKNITSFSVNQEAPVSELKVPELEESHKDLFYSSDVTFLDSSPILSSAPTPSSIQPLLSPISTDFNDNPNLDFASQNSDSISKVKKKSKNLLKPVFSQIRKKAISREELKQCTNILREIKRHPDSSPFLEPVNPVKLKIPDYPNIIKNPMDLTTAENKLLFLAYKNVDEFFEDIHRIFQNCYLYNGTVSPVSLMANRLENLFIKLKQDFKYDSDISDKMSSTQSRRTSAYSISSASHKTTRAPNSSRVNSRKPSYSKHHLESLNSSKSSPSNSSGLSESQQNLCYAIIYELLKEKHLAYSNPFLEPVDWKEHGLLDYPQIITHPMDLSTIKNKLKQGLYKSPSQFESDVRLMFSNCFKYNAPNNPVHISGRKLERIFENKWLDNFNDSSLLSDGHSSKEYSDKPAKKIKSSRTPRKQSVSTLPRTPISPQHLNLISRGSSKRKNSKIASPLIKKATSRKSEILSNHQNEKVFIKISLPAPPPPKITYSQKVQLTEAISNLDKRDILVALDIIRLSNPDLQQSQGEIQIELDSMDNSTLAKLYDYVMSKTQPSKPKKISKKRVVAPQPHMPANLPVSKSASKYVKAPNSGSLKAFESDLKKVLSSSSSSSSSSSTSSDSDSSAYSSSSD